MQMKLKHIQLQFFNIRNNNTAKLGEPMDPSQSHKQEQTASEHQGEHVQSSEGGSIHYEDGKIQKKVYGGGDASTLKEIYIHLIEKQKQTVQTINTNVQTGLTLTEISTILQEKIKSAINNLQVKVNLEGQPVSLERPLSEILEGVSDAKPELYFFYDETKAIIKQKVVELKYDPLTKYSFLDDKSKVKVYLELEGIGKVPAANITSRFLQWSLQIKIHDYKGKNWIFAVPKTQCILKPKDSKVIQKDNKLIISIAKNADSDNWFSLYKVKCVGERDE